MEKETRDNQGQGSRGSQFNENENRGNLGSHDETRNMNSHSEDFNQREFDRDEERFASDSGMASGQSTTRDDSWEEWNGPDAGRSESLLMSDTRENDDEAYDASGSERYDSMGEGYAADSRDTSRLDYEARMASDSDDFNNSGWDESFAPDNDTRNTHSRTFNETEESWENEQRAGSPSTGSDWTENDANQYIADDEQRNASDRYNDTDPDNFGHDNQRNRKELE